MKFAAVIALSAPLAFGMGGCATKPANTDATYAFNKPGTSPGQLNADFSACLAAAPVSAAGPTTIAVADPTAADLMAASKKSVRLEDLNGCMIARGYRWVLMTNAQSKAAQTMAPDQLKNFMGRIGGAQAPETVTP